MSQHIGEISVKVVSILPLASFEGEAILAPFDPRYVVAFVLEDSRQNYSIHGSDVVFPSHQVAFFAIHSVAQLFGASDYKVVGRSYRMRVTMETSGGTTRYRLECL
jgi:hypothetical protein